MKESPSHCGRSDGSVGNRMQEFVPYSFDQDLEGDLTQAVTDFKDAITRDPAFVEPKIGAVSSLV